MIFGPRASAQGAPQAMRRRKPEEKEKEKETRGQVRGRGRYTMYVRGCVISYNVVRGARILPN